MLAHRFGKREKDYNHGTGHGVGCFLNVHEGPFSISRRHGQTVIQKGMVTSVEPGFYLENAYGIRIENLVEVAEASEGYLKIYKFNPCPY